MEESLVKPKVLLVEDDLDLRLLLCALLTDFDVREACTGSEALSLAIASPPDLVLLDRRLPDLDGLEILAELRKQLTTRNVPVIILSALADVSDRIQGLNLGADDYITKPFDAAELLARVTATLRRSQRDLVTDPLTKLPGNAVLRAEIARRLAGEDPFSLCYVDLNDFKAFVDHRGFERASELIQRVAQLCYTSLVDYGVPEDFLGHLGGDDFFFLIGPSRAEAVIADLLEGFDRVSPRFYAEPERERGYIEGVDRYGTPRRFPLTSLSVAVIDVAPGQFENPRDLAEFASHCKSEVKKENQSEGKSNSSRFKRSPRT